MLPDPVSEERLGQEEELKNPFDDPPLLEFDPDPPNPPVSDPRLELRPLDRLDHAELGIADAELAQFPRLNPLGAGLTAKFRFDADP